MGTTNWAHIFAKVGADPDEANRRFLAQNRPPPPTRTEAPAELGVPPHTSKRHQFSTIARRQVRLVVSDRAYFLFLAVLPFVMGALSLTVPGSVGFGVCRSGERVGRRSRDDPDAAHHGRRLHGNRADHPRPDRRAADLPARTGGRPVEHGLPAGQGRGVLHVRASSRRPSPRPSWWWARGRRRGRRCCSARPVTGHPRAVRRGRGDVCGGGDAGPAALGAGHVPTSRSCRCWWCR